MGYLPGRTCQAMNKDARVKFYLHEAKFCICSAWFFVHLPSHWTKERCVEVGVMYAAPCISFFSFYDLKGDLYILCMFCNLFFEVHPGPCVISSMNLA